MNFSGFFCMKLQWHKDLKLGTIMYKKVLVLGFLGLKGLKNGPRMKFLRFYREWKRDMFLLFRITLDQHKGWKFVLTIVVFIVIFIWGKSCFGFLVVNIIRRLLKFWFNVKFVDLFIKTSPPIIKTDIGEDCFWKDLFMNQFSDLRY